MLIEHDKKKWHVIPCNFVNTVQIFITNRCNKRCKGCFNKKRLGISDMPIGLYESIVNSYKNYVKKVILMGGEPLIHQNIIKVFIQVV